MSDLPDEFPCRLLTWDYVDRLARELAHEVRGSYDPDAVVAVVRVVRGVDVGFRAGHYPKYSAMLVYTSSMLSPSSADSGIVSCCG